MLATAPAASVVKAMKTAARGARSARHCPRGCSEPAPGSPPDDAGCAARRPLVCTARSSNLKRESSSFGQALRRAHLVVLIMLDRKMPVEVECIITFGTLDISFPALVLRN